MTPARPVAAVAPPRRRPARLPALGLGLLLLLAGMMVGWMRWHYITGALFGATAGFVGTFVIARRRSLLADVAAHASLPGVCLAFLAGEALGLGGRNPLLLLAGAATTAFLATWSVPRLARLQGVGPDGALAVSLSFFFGLGAVSACFATIIFSVPPGGSPGAPPPVTLPF